MAKNKPHSKGYNPHRQNYINPKSSPADSASTDVTRSSQNTDSLLQKINQAISQMNSLEHDGHPLPTPIAAAVSSTAAAKNLNASIKAASAAAVLEPPAKTVQPALLPVPASSDTTFPFEHARQDEDLEMSYEIEQVQAMDSRLKRKEVLVQEQQKKIKSLKQRITRLEEEARNRNRTIASYQSELIQFSKDLEEKQKMVNTLEEALSELRKKVSQAGESAAINEKLKLAEKEIAGLRTELKQKQQDNLMTSRDLKESKRVYKELQESFDILLAQNTGLEKQVNDLKRVKEEMDSRYTKTLDNLKAEVRLRQSECSKLLREMQELKKEKEDLERLVDGLELKSEMLSSNNSSLQRKLDKVNRQKALLEDQVNHGLVRFALSLVRLFRGGSQDSSSSMSS